MNTAVQGINCAEKKEFTQFELSKALIQSKFFAKNKMSPSARLVLIVLCSHYPNIYPSLKTIQEESGISSKTSVINALKELAKLGIVLYETKNVNHYSFTRCFFELLKPVPSQSNNCTEGGTKIGPKQTSKYKNNNNFKNFNKNDKSDKVLDFKSNKPKYYHNTQETGIKYPKYNPEPKIKETPLDMTKEQAIIFLEKLPENLKNSFFAKELRKKWNFSDADLKQ